jgi:SAM-dependent methyltransferase
LYDELRAINARPEPFSTYTADALWTDEHVSKRMLAHHLDGTVDVSSRRTGFIEASATWTSERFSLGPEASVLDLGCGPGLYTNRWAMSGADVTGIDFSARSIAYAGEDAAEKGLAVKYVQADYLTYQPTRTFDLISMIMCDFSALSPAQRYGLLSGIRTWLAPGGSFLFDVYSLESLAARHEAVSYTPYDEGGFWSPGPHFEFVNTFVYRDQRVSLDRYTIIERHRRRTIYNWLQYFDVASLVDEVERAGFQVDAVLADVAGGAFDPIATEFALITRARSGVLPALGLEFRPGVLEG